MRKSLLSLVVSSILSLSLFSNAASGVEHYVIRIGGDIEGIKAEEGGSTGGETEKPGEEEKDPGDGRLPGTLGIGDNCKKIISDGLSKGDGDYTVTVTGSKKAVYCDMTRDGGGWMLLNDYGLPISHANALGSVGINTQADLIKTMSLAVSISVVNGEWLASNKPAGWTPYPLAKQPGAISFYADGSTRAYGNLRLPAYGTEIMIEAPRIGPTNSWTMEFKPYPNQTHTIDGSFGGVQVMKYKYDPLKSSATFSETYGVIFLDKTWVR